MENKTQKKDIMWFFYETALGRIILKPLITAPVSKFIGFVLSKKISKVFIKGFIKKNGIVLDDFIPQEYSSFNDFFTREIIASRRIFDKLPESLVSPCDARLLHFKMEEGNVFNIKNCEYTVSQLLEENEDSQLSKKYLGGDMLIFRLEATDYHHYAYFDNCKQNAHKQIKGKFHTVREIAYNNVPVFRQNERAVSVLETENFGSVVQIEVGALFVGKITNFNNSGTFSRGSEKGMFEFGGSTIILLFEKDKIKLFDEILGRSKAGIETNVRMGEKIGTKANI